VSRDAGDLIEDAGEALSGIDGDYLDDLEAHISVAPAADDPSTLVIEITYADGQAATLEAKLTVTEVAQ
jgi:hypothetical protein